jgi:hypothetical protein
MNSYFVIRNIFLAIFFIFYTFRDFGVDYLAYDKFMRDGIDLNFINKEYFSWTVISVISKFIDYPFSRYFLFAINSFFLICTTGLIEKKFNLYFFQIFVILSLLPYLGAERQILALSFSFLSVYFIVLKSKVSYFTTIMALLSHTSSIFFVLALKYKYFTLSLLITLIFSYIILDFNFVNFFLLFLFYDDSYINSEVEFRYLISFLKFSFLLLILSMCYNLNFNLLLKNIFMFSILINIFIYYFSALFSAPILASRFGIYFFTLGSAGLFSLFISSYIKNIVNKLFWIILFISFYLSIFYFSPIFIIFFNPLLID